MLARESLKARPALVTVAAFCLAALGPRTSFCQSTSVRSSPASTELRLTAHSSYLDATAREPMIVEHPDGTLFVTGYEGHESPSGEQTVPRLWRSSDHGGTWSAVNVGTEGDGAVGNSDVDLAVARDGTLYFVSMGYDAKKNEGTHIAVGVSTDSAKTWHWTMLSKHRYDDRPWVVVAPDGGAHVIWNDGSGVYHAVSRDRGTTWTVLQAIHPGGGSSHLSVGPNGELAARIVPLSASGNKFSKGFELVAVSTDGGATWQKHPVPGQRNWAFSADGATPRWVEPVAWDAKGGLYLLWTEVSGVWLARSLDLGVTWQVWRIAESEGDALSYYPYLVARGPGELAATWFTGTGDSLVWQLCKIRVGDHSARPQLLNRLLSDRTSGTHPLWGVRFKERREASIYLS